MGLIEKYSSILSDSMNGSLNGNILPFIYDLENIEDKKSTTLKLIIWFNELAKHRNSNG